MKNTIEITKANFINEEDEFLFTWKAFKSGDPSQLSTGDLTIMSRSLLPTELRGQLCITVSS